MNFDPGANCANCAAFQWKQPESAVRMQCSRCKVVKYCSEECQAEHWKLVHSKHCKKLAAAKKDESEGKNTSPMPVGIFSNHPFPLDGLKGDVYEALLICMEKILEKMRSINHPVFSTFPDELRQFEHDLAVCRKSIWFQRKIGVPDYNHSPFGLLCSVFNIVVGRGEDPFGLWQTLLFILDRVLHHFNVDVMKILKQPREDIPEKFWENLDEDQIEVFTSRLEALVKAFGRPQFPSCEELLKIFCGGSLDQACSFCASSMSVAAVFVKGSKDNTPLVMILPGLPPLFSCCASICNLKMQKRYDAWRKWLLAVGATYRKLEKNRCDSCFKQASQVHRSLLLFSIRHEVLDIQLCSGVSGASPRPTAAKSAGRRTWR